MALASLCFGPNAAAKPEKGTTKNLAVKHNEEIVDRVYFSAGSAALSHENRKVLDAIVNTALQDTTIVLIRVEGHADNAGKASVNLKLSKDRSETVRQYLCSSGIAPTKVQAQYFGATQPGTPGALDKTSPRRNRRVDLVVVRRIN